MYNLINELIKDKNVLILGFGKEGKSTFEVLNKVGSYKSLSIADKNEVVLDGYKCICGDNYQDSLDDFDVVFKSPGIVLNKDIDSYKCLITDQMNLFLQRYKKQVIGITGTKGKSTTSSFTYHLLKECGKDCLFAGNIGIPVFDLIEKINEKTIIVLEISCHQLEYAKNSPHIAILLNVYQEHLDHYGTLEKYRAAKENIYKNQDKDDYLIVNLGLFPNKYKGNLTVIGTRKLPFKSFTEIDAKLVGMHNLYNISAVYEVAKILNLSDLEFVKAVSSFKPLEHRLEFVCSRYGINWYNDSISTICESAISAIESTPNIETILIGGMDRGIDYSPLIKFLKKKKCKNICFMYASGKRIYEEMGNVRGLNITYVNTLGEAVNWAKEATSIDKAVVLSPASASYGYFKNFEERGQYYKQLVENL